ncbi:MAG: outer membrane beta-barrel protein [Candidatus Aminicenantes bacterium]|nr:outer membrane beta-barrel protein [Candidatus Aminicenantes bacterium]
MKKRQAFAVAFCLACTLVLGAQENKIKVVTETANIHIEPHRTSAVIETVKRGTILTLFESGHKQKAWYYISFYSEEKWATITGFIEAAKVDLMGGAPPPKELETEAAAEDVEKEKAEVEVEEKKRETEVITESEVVSEKAAVQESPLVRVSGEVRVIGGDALLRATPREESRILAMMPSGTPLELAGKKGDWFRVKYSQEEGVVVVGFVHQADVSMFAQEEATAEQTVAKIEKPEDKTEEVTPPDLEVEQEVEMVEEELQESKPMGIEMPGFSVGLLGGYALPSEEGYGGAFAFGFSLTYRATPNIAVEVSGIRYQSQLEGSSQGLSRGKLTVSPIFLSLKGRYPLNQRLAPYAVIGAGYFFNSFVLCDGVQSEWNSVGFDVMEEVENSAGFQVGVGLDYFVMPNFSVNIDIRYLMSKSKGSWSFSDQFGGTAVSGNLDDLNQNALVLGIGVKFFFSIF